MSYKNKQGKTITMFIAISVIIGIFLTMPVYAATEKDNYNKNLSVGESHALIIDSQGNVWAMGNNDYYQIGDGTNISRTNPVMVYSGTWNGKAKSVAAGSRQSLVLLEDGTVLQWGYGTAVHKTEIVQNAIEISAGQEMCMAILKNKTAVCWSDKMNQRTITDSFGYDLENVKEISVGSNNFLILRESINGKVYQVETSNYSQAYEIPLKPSLPEVTPTPTTSSTEPVSSQEISQQEETLKFAVSISAGDSYGIALLASGKVYSWGYNNSYGVLGIGTDISDNFPAQQVLGLSGVSMISAGANHAIALKESGMKYGWGYALDRRLDSTHTEESYLSPVPLNLNFKTIASFDCGDSYNLAFNSAGELYMWGDGKSLTKLTLKQTLINVPNPSISAKSIGDQSMTIAWNPSQFFLEMSVGFRVTYTMPDGTVGKTQLLPTTQSQITLLGLQPATNYKVALLILGKTGFEESTPVVVIQTKKDDGVSPSPAPTIEPTTENSSKEKSIASSSGVESDVDPKKAAMANIFNIILISIAFLILVAAVIAIIYVWKRMGNNETDKINARRVSPDDGVNSNSPQNSNIGNNTSSRNNAVPAELAGRILISKPTEDEEDKDVKIVLTKKEEKATKGTVQSNYEGAKTFTENDFSRDEKNANMSDNLNNNNDTSDINNSKNNCNGNSNSNSNSGISADRVNDGELESQNDENKENEMYANLLLDDSSTYDEDLDDISAVNGNDELEDEEEDDDDFIVRKPGEPRK